MRKKNTAYWVALGIGQLLVFGILFWLGAVNNWFGIWPIAWGVLAWFAGVVYSTAVHGGTRNA